MFQTFPVLNVRKVVKGAGPEWAVIDPQPGTR